MVYVQAGIYIANTKYYQAKYISGTRYIDVPNTEFVVGAKKENSRTNNSKASSAPISSESSGNVTSSFLSTAALPRKKVGSN